MNDVLYSYDTTTLFPEHSSLPSRDIADTSVNFCGEKFKLPVVPSNMKDVISIDNAEWLSKNGYFYIYHRFDEGNECTKNLVEKASSEDWPLVSISMGVSEKNMADMKQFIDFPIDFITIDVAHADHENIKPAINFVRQYFPKVKLIVGNVATYEGTMYLCKLGVDAIKVGIGGGSICTTRYMTGFHIPTLQSVKDACSALRMCGPEKEYGVPIIADGGAKHYGDIAKALTFGATMVMSGGWFASCINSPAKIINGKKVYRGSTSYELKGNNRHVEGIQLELNEGITYSQRMQEIKDALTSSISYAGGNNLSAFKKVKWSRILPFH